MGNRNRKHGIETIALVIRTKYIIVAQSIKYLTFNNDTQQ